MKRLAFLFALISFTTLISCGGDNSGENNDEQAEAPIELKGFEELNLTEWGFNLTVMVPQAETHGDPEVELTERGALEIAWH